MAGKSDYLAAMQLNLILRGVVDAALAATAGSVGTLYWALHTSDPGDSGAQDTNEVTTGQYATYTRIAVTRGSGNFTAPASLLGISTCYPAVGPTFPTTSAVGSGCTATHFSLGTAPSGAGTILYSGPITPNIIVPTTTAGVIPQLTTATAISES